MKYVTLLHGYLLRTVNMTTETLSL